LWKNECVSSFADRFVINDDKVWFNSELVNLVTNELGPDYTEMAEDRVIFWCNFMQDAPEPTGEEGEDIDMELPRVYEPVESLDILRERLNMFLGQFNEMVRGNVMDLVFFPDAMVHLVKISRPKYLRS
jgi:dynein heavy chain, axonemal